MLSYTNKKLDWPERIEAFLDHFEITQSAFAEYLKVQPASITQWRNGTKPNAGNQTKLEACFKTPEKDVKMWLKEYYGSETAGGEAQDEEEELYVESNDFGEWVRHEMDKQNTDIRKLAREANVSSLTIDNIINGRSQNPQERTRTKIAEALKTTVPASVKQSTTVPLFPEGVGVPINFDPHDRKTWPSVSGVYILYASNDNVVYVGKSKNDISKRLQVHYDLKWYNPRIVKNGSYIEIKSSQMCLVIEQLLIKVLKGNILVNRVGVIEGSDPED